MIEKDNMFNLTKVTMRLEAEIEVAYISHKTFLMFFNFLMCQTPFIEQEWKLALELRELYRG